MGFNLVLSSGDDNRLMGEELAGCLVEVRVEQKLDDPTSFGVRFLEDIKEGKPQKSRLAELKLETVISIAVPDKADQLVCLCRGPILEHKSDLTLGGPGSTFTVLGTDRRDILTREHREGNWSGKASDVVTTLLQEHYPDFSVDPTEKTYTADSDPLPQRGTDLDFIKKNALENGFHFWISYKDVNVSVTGTSTVSEIANWKASPPLVESSPLDGLLAALPLSDDSIVLRVNVKQEKCPAPNVTKFQLSTDGAQPNQMRSSTQNGTDGEIDRVSASDQSSPMVGGQARVSDAAAVRFIPPQPSGDSQEARTISEAALREAGFSVKADISTTFHLLKRVLMPHQVVSIEGLGNSNGPVSFRVIEVTHVINGAEHFMDAKLDTNVALEA